MKNNLSRIKEFVNKEKVKRSQFYINDSQH